MSDATRTADRQKLIPYLTVKDGHAALEWYKKIFGSDWSDVTEGPDGKVMHAEIHINNSRLMLCDEFPEMGSLSPQSGGDRANLYLYVDDVDATFAAALAAGAKEERPVSDEFYGERVGTFLDPFGHRWSVTKVVREVSAEEIQAAMKEWAAQQG